MFVHPATGAEPPAPGQPPPAPARWHLRTQVSRKTLFDLIQDKLPPGGLTGAGLPGDEIQISDEDLDQAVIPWSPAPQAGHGVLPAVYLDQNAATVPISLNPSTLWNDGDTNPDIPEHWRPITITLASAALTSQAQLPAPPSPAPPVPPLQGVVKRAAWMLSGVALTFLVGAAAFGGRPMIQAVRSVLTRSQAQAATLVVAPAAAAAPLIVSPPPPVSPVEAPVTHAAVAAREPAPAPARGSRRPRPERRTGRQPTTTPDLLLGEDAVMPLESAALHAPATPTRPSPTALARTTPPRTFRPIDVEDPFGGR